MTAYPKTELPGVTIYQGSCLDVLPTLPEKSVHCCVTSVPYWSLRDYGTATWEGGDADCDHLAPQGGASEMQITNQGSRQIQYRDTCGKCGARRVDQQLGLESRLDCLGWATGDTCGECWICHMVQVFAGVHRVLRDDGTLFLNTGDSYVCTPNGRSAADTKRLGKDDRTFHDKPDTWRGAGVPQKNLAMQPARLALALQAWGWYVRSEIVWVKVSPMPESVSDRPTCAHEKIFLLTKKPTYFYDADSVREPAATSTLARVALADNRALSEGEAESKATLPDDYKRCKQARVSVDKYQDGRDHLVCAPPTNGRNQRNVWTLSPSSFSEAHFATFPPDLPKRAILAGTSEKGVCPCCGAPWVRVTNSAVEGTQRNEDGAYANHEDNDGTNSWLSKTRVPCTRVSETTGWKPSCTCPHTEDEVQPAVVLDCFSGAGTTLLVAAQLGRRAVGIELNAEYISMSARRIAPAAAQETLRF